MCLLSFFHGLPFLQNIKLQAASKITYYVSFYGTMKEYMRRYGANRTHFIFDSPDTLMINLGGEMIRLSGESHGQFKANTGYL